MDKMLTDSDLKHYIPNSIVIKDSELANYDSLLDLLPNPVSTCFILIESKLNEGHWVCLNRLRNNFSYFDSYGVLPDGELKFINLITLKKLHENVKYLTLLFKKLPKEYKWSYNKFAFQKHGNNINTCGRWCVVSSMFNNLQMTNKQMIDFFKEKKNQTGKSYDELVVDLIS